MPTKDFSLVLRDYCHIVQSIPQWKRKERHALLQTWLAREYALPCYAELVQFFEWADKVDFPINPLFEKKIILPMLDVEIFCKNNASAMKMMLLRFDSHALAIYKNDFSFNLLSMTLKLLPDDSDVLHYQWKMKVRYYEYTLHEIPRGVLWDKDGARLEHMEALESGLNELETLSKKLGEDVSLLIRACRDFYAVWRLYIEQQKPYSSFENCIQQNRSMLSAEAIKYVVGERGILF